LWGVIVGLAGRVNAAAAGISKIYHIAGSCERLETRAERAKSTRRNRL
jgi:hypothetical protein